MSMPNRTLFEGVLAAQSVLQEGDLIFLDIPNLLFRSVAAGTGTWTSHVGIAFIEDGQWVVFESTFPRSKVTSLQSYIRKSSHYKFEIKRLDRPLTANEIDTLRSTAKSLLGRCYHLGFDFDSRRLYCSKFTYLSYQSLGIELGRVETFTQLFANNPDASLTFWRFWFFGRVPWRRRTVTPASQLNDEKLISISRRT